jgi:hypothetical protein
VVGAADQAAAVGAQELGRLVEDDLDVARVLAVLGGQLSRPRAGLDGGQLDEPSLGFRDHLVRDREDVGRPQLGRAGEQRREVVARPHLWQAGQRVRSHTVAALTSRSSTARVRGAASPRVPSARRSAARSSGVSTSRPSEASSRILTVAPAARASAA